MFSGFLIAFIIGAGTGFWLYSKFQRSSGGNKKNAAIGAVVAAILIAVVGTIIIDLVFKKFK